MLSKYPNFNDIENAELRAWNRASVFFNIMASESIAMAKGYISMFNDEDRQSVNTIFNHVRANGYDATRSSIIKRYNEEKPSEPTFDERENQVVH